MPDAVNISSNTAANRGVTAGVILCMLGCFIALSSGMSSTREKTEQRNKAESAYIESNGCVVAQMEGRFVSKYRCEKPEPRYLSAAELAREAMTGVVEG